MKRLKTKIDGLLNFSDYKKGSHRIVYYIFIFLLVVFAMTALLPLLWLFVTSFKELNELHSVNYHLFPEKFNLMKMIDVWKKLNFGRYYINTIIVVLGSVVSAVVFNSLLAYAVAILKPVGHRIINALILLGYMIPGALAIFPLVMQIKNVNLINSYVPLWLAFGANAYYYLLFKNYFEKMPKSLIEAAKIDGLNDFQIFIHVILPLARPIIGVVAIFAMTAAYSDFLLPYTVLQKTELQTVMVAIYRLNGTTTVDESEKLLLIVISIIPQLILFAIFQKQIMNQSVNSGMKD